MEMQASLNSPDQASRLKGGADGGMVRVPASLVSPGRRLRFDVFDENGQLLLVRGAVIESEALARLIRQSGYRRQPARRQASTFGAMTAIADRLTIMEEDLVTGRDGGIWSRRLRHLVRDFIEVSDADPDAAFANIHLEIRHSYFVVHSLMAALVSARVALARGLSAEARFSLTAGALTHDFGMLPMRERLSALPDLSPEYRDIVREHAVDGVRLLRRLGIDDPLWLSVIEDHHEYLDGSGYAGKRGDEIFVPARIVALADAYSAMLRPRPYRERVLASQALETLYAEEFERYDRSIIETLLWDLGFYPPGSLVRLAGREMAVAVRNTPGLLDSPLVAVLTDANGHPLLAPVLRDPQNHEFAIVEALDPAQAARVGKLIEQCWQIPGTCS